MRTTVLSVLAAAHPALAQAGSFFQLGPPAPDERQAAPEAAEPRGDSLLSDDLFPASPAGDHATVEAGMAEFFATRFSAYEPMYFVAGGEEPEAKFQISLKYQVVNPAGSMVEKNPWLADLYLAYSQTSFWDLGKSNSSPIFDSSYRPELLYQVESPNASWFGQSRFDFQAGVQHESNGKGGLDSRSLNIVYIRPIFTWGDDGTSGSTDFFIAVAPRLWAYWGDTDENPDIYRYRGYGDLKLITGWRSGLQAAATVRIGNDFDKGSLLLDLSYPLRGISSGNFDFYLYGQLFTGVGESLLEYDESDTTFRLGVSLVR